MKMFCARCGRDRTVGSAAADPGPCPDCQSTSRSSVKPVFGSVMTQLPIPLFTFTVSDSFVTPGDAA